MELEASKCLHINFHASLQTINLYKKLFTYLIGFRNSRVFSETKDKLKFVCEAFKTII